MSEALVQVSTGPQAIDQVQQGGLGIDFGSKLFTLKPATVAINQRMTQAEGAIPGKLRIVETGDQFDEMSVALLVMPTEARQYYVGEPGQLNRTQDNLMCFSRDLIRPDAKAKQPQAIKCANCPRADWAAWTAKKEATGINDLTLIPPCEAYYYALFIDTVYKLPLQMYVRGGENKSNFEAGMRELARKFKLLQAQGENPNIFDLRFTMSVTPGKKKTNFVLKIDGKSVRKVTDEERASFGEIYLSYVNRGKRSAEEQAQAEAADAVDEVQATIESQVVTPGTETAPVTGEIVI